MIFESTSPASRNAGKACSISRVPRNYCVKPGLSFRGEGGGSDTFNVGV